MNDNKSDRFAYILLTPAKNEESNLPALIQSVASQELIPVAWFIVDDASEDNTARIIKKSMLDCPWIHYTELTNKGSYRLGKHVATVRHKGFSYALKYCDKNGIEFNYIASSDADTIYPKDYFKRIVSFLDENEEFGIVGGKVLIQDINNKTYEEKTASFGEDYDFPRGTGRVWARKAFEDSGGFPVVRHWDTISNITAISKGWKVRNLTNVKCYQTRNTGGRINLWHGYAYKGAGLYFLNANPLIIFNSVADMLFVSRPKNAIIKSLALISGYLQACAKGEERYNNEIIKKYHSYKQTFRHYGLFLKELARKLLSKLS